MDPEPRHPLARALALNRTVTVVLVTVLFFGLGEELWARFMPVYLQAQTKELARAGVPVGWQALVLVGIYGFCLNLFEGVCYLGGGQLTARLGDRGSLLLFAVTTMSGYVLFLTVPGAWASVLAALLILSWDSLSVPVTFTTVGATVADERRGMAFAVQSIQKRLPKVLGPLLAGFVLGAFTRLLADEEAAYVAGTRALVFLALGLTCVSLVIQLFWMPHREPNPPGVSLGTILRQLHPTLRRLLVAEVLTRWCDWLVRDYVVLYLVLVRGVRVEAVGALLALQHVTALVTYLPVGRLTRSVGLRPFIGVTFVFFALFPLVLAWSPNIALAVAFIVYGLREIGEPARKALITSLIPPTTRARGVGLYWGLRSFALCTAPLAGAALWAAWGPEALFHAAFGIGCLGAFVYYRYCR